MAYQAELSRSNRSCILFLIDRSRSMLDPFGKSPHRLKKDGVADAVNKLLHTLVSRCATAEEVRDIYDIGVIGYGMDTGPAFGGELAGRDLVPITEVADGPVRIEERKVKLEDGAGGIIEQTKRFPVWFDPVADGATPMVTAFRRAEDILFRWLNGHEDSYPPIVINITDGEPTDGEPAIPAQAIREMKTNDGNVLVFNCHISDQQCEPIEFPHSPDHLPDDHARRLFDMSSELPPRLYEEAVQEGYPLRDGARGFVFNADLIQLINFLDIGTRASYRPIGDANDTGEPAAE